MTRAVAYFGTYDPVYPRSAVLIAGLRELGVEVLEFRAPLPALTAAQMATPGGAARLAAGIVEAHARLFAQHKRRLDIDAVVVGYPGHFLVPFGRVLAAFRRTRLVFDPLVSLWDTFAGDRGLVAPGGWKAAAVRAVDRVAFSLPDIVLADTWAHATYYATALSVSPPAAGGGPGGRAAGAAGDRGRASSCAGPAADRVPVRQVEPAARRRDRARGGGVCCAPSRSASSSRARDSSQARSAPRSRGAGSRT